MRSANLLIRLLGVAALVTCSTAAWADIDPDCRNPESLVCEVTRVSDVEALDAQLTPRIGAIGWNSHCFSVMYVGGDESNPKDAVVLTLYGAGKLTSASTCRSPGSSPATNADLRQAMKILSITFDGLMGAIRARLTHNLDLLMVTNGDGAELRRRWR